MKIGDSLGVSSYLERLEEQKIQNVASFSEFLQKNMKFDSEVKTDKFTDALNSVASALSNKENSGVNSDNAKSQTDDANVISSQKILEQAKKDEQMFKNFDFLQIMNQLMYGNLSETEQNKLMQKAMKIANEA